MAKPFIGVVCLGGFVFSVREGNHLQHGDLLVPRFQGEAGGGGNRAGGRRKLIRRNDEEIKACLFVKRTKKKHRITESGFYRFPKTLLFLIRVLQPVREGRRTATERHRRIHQQGVHQKPGESDVQEGESQGPAHVRMLVDGGGNVKWVRHAFPLSHFSLFLRAETA